MSSDEGRALLRTKGLVRSISHAEDELRNFRSYLRWMCVDQSNRWRAILSWIFFLIFAIIVPIFSRFVLICNGCDSTFDGVVQLSLSLIATLSFLCIAGFIKRYGLRRFLFLDKLCHESEKVREGYTDQLNGSFKLLSYFVFPCFMLEIAYKIWWYCAKFSRIPFLGNPIISDIVACFLELYSWLYRMSIFFLVCVLFRLICHLEILRLQDFAEVFQQQSDVCSVLKGHLKIRRELRILSHRFRIFIVCAMILVTANLFASLLVTTRSHSDIKLLRAGEVALCSMGLVTGLSMCLRSAARITHKAQAITSHAARWHVCSTIESFDTSVECENSVTDISGHRVFHTGAINDESENELFDEEGMDDAPIFLPYIQTISFQKRQALVQYFEHNRAGITLFGVMLDRTWLHTIFMIELSLFLWLLGKTIGI